MILRLRGPDEGTEARQAWEEAVRAAAAAASRARVRGEDLGLVFDDAATRIEIAGGRAIVRG